MRAKNTCPFCGGNVFLEFFEKHVVFDSSTKNCVCTEGLYTVDPSVTTSEEAFAMWERRAGKEHFPSFDENRWGSNPRDFEADVVAMFTSSTKMSAMSAMQRAESAD